jgi:signal transduction histidine kinase
MRLNTPAISDDEAYITCQALVAAYLHADREKSLEYLRKGIRVAEKINNYVYFVELYYNAGNLFYYINQPDSARFYWEQALDMYSKANNKGVDDQADLDYMHMRIFVSLAAMDYTAGRYDLALEKYYKALEINEKMNKPEDAAMLCISIAQMYKFMSNPLQAETYYLKGEKIFRELSDSLGIARPYQGLCADYIQKEDYPKALEYGEESYRILSALPSVVAQYLWESVRNLTEVWLQIPDYDQALEYALKSVDYARQTHRQDCMAAALSSLSNCYLKQEKYKEAEETAFRALAIDSTKTQINSGLYQIIAMSNIGLKNSAKAIEYFNKTMDAKDAYSNQNFQASLSEMDVKYKTEKKEAQIAALKAEKRLMIWLGIAGGGVLLLGLATLFFRWRWTVQKRRLAEQQKQFAEQQHFLAEARIKQLEQEKQLIATQSVLDGEVQERTRLARDLHDGLGGKLTGMKLHLQELKRGAGFNEAEMIEFDKTMRMLDDSVNEMRRLVSIPANASSYR